MKYSYHKGPPIKFDYDELNSPLHVWPDDCASRDYSPLVALTGWYWPATHGSKVSLKDVRSDITAKYDLDTAIDIILNDWGIEYVGEAVGTVFTGNGTVLGPMSKLVPHVHAPIKEYNYEKCPNLTVIVPIKIVEPVTEEFCLNHQDYVPWDKVDFNTITHDDWKIVADSMTVIGEVERIKLPEAGEYLVVEFEGSHDYHWVENISNNHYLYLVLEGHVRNDT